MTNYHSNRLYRLACAWIDAEKQVIREIIHIEMLNSIVRANSDRKKVSRNKIQEAIWIAKFGR